MKRTRHSVELHGVTFEVNDNDAMNASFDSLKIRTQWTYNTIWDAYNKPSVYKEEAWQEWCKWINDNYAYGDYEIVISGRNCMMFTISAKVREKDGTAWYLWITRDHNRAYKLVG